jgi:hypothetical protein
MARLYIDRMEEEERSARRREAEVEQWEEQVRRNDHPGRGRDPSIALEQPVRTRGKRDPFLPPQATYDMPHCDKVRIGRVMEAIAARRPPATRLPTRVGKEEREELFAAAREMRLGGMASPHEVDEAFAALHADAPWLSAATQRLWRQARLGASKGMPFRVGPMVLVGPPGCGKSTLARRLGSLFDLPTVEVDVGQTSGVFDLQGTDSKWGGSSPGRVSRSLLSTRIGNPVVVVDEIDAGGSMGAERDGSRFRSPSIHKVLMGMVEPAAAASWTCPYYEVAMDLRHHSWVMTANSVAHVEGALLDRCQVVTLDVVERAHVLTAARRMAVARLDEESAEFVVTEVERALRRGAQLGLRQLSRLVDAAEAAALAPRLH